jgi:hypothetical protein
MIFKVYLMRIGGRRRPWRDILNSVPTLATCAL